MLDLVKVKVRLGKHKIPITLLVHDSASMGYFNCPGLFDVAQKLESKGFHLADHDRHRMHSRVSKYSLGLIISPDSL